MSVSSDREEDFARAYSRLVSRLVRPLFLRGGDQDDLYQEGMIGLLQAVRSYDPQKNSSFEAYAALCVRSRLYDAVRSDASGFRREEDARQRLILDGSGVPQGSDDPEALCLANESAKEIQAALHGLLSAFESSVLDPYLEGYTVNEIAARLGRPQKSVHNAVGRIRLKAARYLSEKGDSRETCSHNQTPQRGKEREKPCTKTRP